MSISLTQEQINIITDYINGYRLKHHAKPIAHDTTITTFSQSYSDQLISTNKFEHSKNKLYGENLAYFGGLKNDTVALIKKAIDAWYSEVKDYDYAKATFASGTGHFTQLCWNSSTKFGVGCSYNATTRTAIITMNFNPPGNMMGRFKENVSPI